MERAKNRIAVIGGGISGLTAAYEINKAIQKEKLPFNFILLERRNQIGGMVKTIETEGHSIDVGAASFDIRRGDIRPFLEELGLFSEIQYSINGKTDRYNSHDFIFNKKPTYHGIPIRRKDFLYDRGLTLQDKLKVIINGSFHKQKKSGKHSISTSQFLEYRFCKDVVSFIAYPHYPENIYGSMELCPPNFFDPNLIDLFEYPDGLLNNRDEKIESYEDKPGNEFNLLNGMRDLVERLKQTTKEYIETGKQVTGMEILDQGLVLLKVNETEEIRVGSVISSIPLTESHQILDKRWKESQLIPKPIVSSMCTIFFQFKKGTITKYPKGYGFVIPKRSSFHITKTTLLNRKWPSFKDSEYDFLLVEFGRRQEETLIQLDDEAILSIIEKELTQIMGLKNSYHFARVFRWQHAVPHLQLEDRQKLERNKYRLDSFFRQRGIFIGGNGLRGYGLPNAIAEGKELAQAAITYMREQTDHPLLPFSSSKIY